MRLLVQTTHERILAAGRILCNASYGQNPMFVLDYALTRRFDTTADEMRSGAAHDFRLAFRARHERSCHCRRCIC